MTFILREDQSPVAHARVDLGRKQLGQVCGVGNGDDDEFALFLLSPIEDIIEHLLVLGSEVVDFIDDNDSTFNRLYFFILRYFYFDCMGWDILE